jgi:hypothetical protein
MLDACFAPLSVNLIFSGKSAASVQQVVWVTFVTVAARNFTFRVDNIACSARTQR